MMSIKHTTHKRQTSVCFLEYFRIAPLLVIVLLMILQVSPAFALSTAPVSADDPAYRDIEKLAAFGLIAPMRGQRPFSRHYFAILIREAEQNITDGKAAEWEDLALELVSRLKKRFGEDLDDKGPSIRFHPLESAAASITVTSNDSRLPPDQNMGTTRAEIDPINAFHRGRHFAKDGATFSATSEHFVGLSPFFSIYAAPLVEFETDKNYVAGRLTAETFDAKTVFHNISLEVGRNQVVRGFGQHGGLIHTDNARGFDGISLSNDLPVRLPWLFRHIGDTKVTAFVAHMGPEYVFENTFLGSWSLNISPLPILELDLTHSIFLGGDSLPSLSPEDAVREFIGFIPAFKDANTPGDSIVETGFNLTLPFLRRSQLYFQFAFDDHNKELDVFFLHDCAYSAGFYVPRITPSGKIDLRAEYQHTVARMFTHSVYVSGKSLNNKSFGTPIGPDADKLNLLLNWDATHRDVIGVEAALEIYRSDLYAPFPNGDDIQDIIKTADGPQESRYRLATNWQHSWETLTIVTDVAYEFVRSFAFVPNDNRSHFRLGASLIYRNW